VNLQQPAAIQDRSACGAPDVNAVQGGSNLLVLPSHEHSRIKRNQENSLKAREKDPMPSILEADFAQTFGASFKLPRGESRDELHSRLRRRHCAAQPKAVSGRQSSTSSTANPMHARLKSVFEIEPQKAEPLSCKNGQRASNAGQCEAPGATVEPQSKNVANHENKTPTMTAVTEAKSELQAKFQVRLKNTLQTKEKGRQETPKEASGELPIKAKASSELQIKAKTSCEVPAKASSELQAKLKARLECVEQPLVQRASGPSQENTNLGRKSAAQLQAASSLQDPVALTLVRREKSTSDLHSKTVEQEATMDEVIRGVQATLKPIPEALSEAKPAASKDDANSELHAKWRARLKSTESSKEQQPQLKQAECANKSVGALISFHLPDQEDQTTLFSTTSLAGDWWMDLSAGRFKTYDFSESADDGESAETGSISGYEAFGCESDWWGHTSPPELSTSVGGQRVWDMLTCHVSAEPDKGREALKQHQTEFQKLQRKLDDVQQQHEAEMQKMRVQLEEAQRERKAAQAAQLQAEAKLMEAQRMAEAAECARQRAEAESLEAQSEAELHKLQLQMERAEKVEAPSAPPVAVALEVVDEDTDDTV